LKENTRGLLNRQFKDFREEEHSAKMPLMMFNAVVGMDGRKMVISTQPVSFMMKPIYDSSSGPVPEPDEIDFAALFHRQDPLNLRLLTALRMNATFPYVLPNVWLPSKPVIDVMDAGLRDNFGAESALRFVNVFSDWLKENTAGVILIQVRDRRAGGWDDPFVTGDISELATKPMLLLQNNWYKMQEYNQDNLFGLSRQLMDGKLSRLSFQYSAKTADAKAALNFHLTQREKNNIMEALNNDDNSRGFSNFSLLLSSEQAAAQKIR
jgi:hypothetical protein